MRSVRVRLATLLAAICGAIVAIFFLSLHSWLSDRRQDEIDATVQAELRRFSRCFLDGYEGGRRGAPSGLQGELSRFTELSQTAAEVRAADGTKIYGTPGFAAPPDGAPFDVLVNGVPHRGGRSRVTTADGLEFTLLLAVDAESRLAPLRQLRLYAAVFGPLVLLVAWVLGYLFVGQSLTPVEVMRQQAERISRENLSERIPELASQGELRNLARTLNEMLERLDRAFQDLQNFATDAAHELRTPLANMRAQIDVLLQDSKLAEESEAELIGLGEDVTRMRRIVDDLFLLAKLDMRQYALEKEPVRLLPLAQEIRDTWQQTAREQGIDIGAEGQDMGIQGDPVALRRILMNLVENAIKHSHSGGRIQITVGPRNGKARVQVRDSGRGIPPEHLGRLFKRFYQVDPSRSRDSGGGAGLGLAICKSLAEAHEGTIGVESTPGQGTTFTVEFPAA